MPTPLLTIADCGVNLGDRWLLRHADLTLHAGDRLALVGRNGAGKSTLLAILGMYDGDWTGEYHLHDSAIHKLNQRARSEINKEHIGFVFQQFHLLDDLTVAENLDIPLSYRNIKKAERASLVADTLDRFNIVGKKDLYPSQLSGGQQQLVAVARAVISKPSLILADEPTGNLDPQTSIGIMRLLDRINRTGTTVVMATHDRGIVDTMRRRVIELDRGVIVRDQARGVYE